MECWINFICLIYLSFFVGWTDAFNVTRSDNVVAYYGQNSYGDTHPSDVAHYQQTLSHYCQDDDIDVIPLAFLNIFFSTGGLPSLDLANTCSTNTGVFDGTQLPNCSFLADDIKECQAKGKLILMSLGGATGANDFTDKSQAVGFADQLWNLLLGGTSSTRPFGDAVLDGIDLDIEGGSQAGFVDFVQRIRWHTDRADKRYYITAAPQCPYPDAYVGNVINQAAMDMIFVQFYNNYCSVAHFDDSNAWNYATWDEWARKTSPNKLVKVYIGAPASDTAAGEGYVGASILGNIARDIQNKYSSFGGIMLWDVSQAYNNGRYDSAVKAIIRQKSSPPPPMQSQSQSHTTTVMSTAAPTSTTHTNSIPQSSSVAFTSSATPSPSGAPSSCQAASSWVQTQAYSTGDIVTYNKHLWLAVFWNYAAVPGIERAGSWSDEGPCL